MDNKDNKFNGLSSGGARRPVRLSSDLVKSITNNIQSGEYQKSRGLIATGLEINDALAEVSFKHIRSSLENNSLNPSKLENLMENSQNLSSKQFREVLHEVFGIHGRAADTIMKKAGF